MAKIRTVDGRRIEVKVRDLVGMLCRPRCDLRSKVWLVPAGTLCRISSTWRSGVTLSPLVTPMGAIAGGEWIGITQVHRDDIELDTTPQILDGLDVAGFIAAADVVDRGLRRLFGAVTIQITPRPCTNARPARVGDDLADIVARYVTTRLGADDPRATDPRAR